MTHPFTSSNLSPGYSPPQLHLALVEVTSDDNNNKLWYIPSVEYYTRYKKESGGSLHTDKE